MKKLSFTDIYKMKKLAASLNARDFYLQYVKHKGISYDDFRKKFLKQNPNISELQFETVKFNPSGLMAKRSAAMLTPLAQAAAMPPPPTAPPMGGAPMDPAMMGGMPPAGDPAAMGGAPMDPAMMGGDPAAMGGMPPPGAWMQDQMFLLFLMSMGFQQGPDGSFMDPNGQPIPPLMMDQIYMLFLMQMQAQGGMPPQGGAPMDPAMMGGMPPAGDPAAMGGMPPEDLMPPAELPPEIMEQVSGMVQDIISSEFEQRFSTLDKKITAFNLKLDTIKTLLDDILVGGSKLQKNKAEEDSLNSELLKDLKSSQQVLQQQIPSTEAMLASQQPNGNMLDIMRG